MIIKINSKHILQSKSRDTKKIDPGKDCPLTTCDAVFVGGTFSSSFQVDNRFVVGGQLFYNRTRSFQ